jgi:hypothetical protein
MESSLSICQPIRRSLFMNASTFNEILDQTGRTATEKLIGLRFDLRAQPTVA